MGEQGKGDASVRGISRRWRDAGMAGVLNREVVRRVARAALSRRVRIVCAVGVALPIVAVVVVQLRSMAAERARTRAYIADARKALDALYALQSVVSSGVTYQEYGRRVNDARIAVDRFLRAQPVDRALGSQEAIRGAIEEYEGAAVEWGEKLAVSDPTPPMFADQVKEWREEFMQAHWSRSWHDDEMQRHWLAADLEIEAAQFCIKAANTRETTDALAGSRRMQAERKRMEESTAERMEESRAVWKRLMKLRKQLEGR